MVDGRVGLFQAALGIAAPWQVIDARFDPERGRLDITLDFPAGARFACPEGDSDGCAVHDTADKTWRHLDFFQHRAYLHARVPRVRCAVHGVRQVGLGWARPGSGFTLLFEALLLEFAPHMPVAAIARTVGEHDTRIWRVLEHYVAAARAQLDMSQVSRVGVDETSARRGQDYVTLFMDLDSRAVLFATDGRDAATVARFGQDLADHGGDPGKVTSVCCDMSPAFISGVAQHLPAAQVTFDRYHVIAQLNAAVDEVRRSQRRSRPELAASKYVWLKRPERLSGRQAEKLAWLTRPSARLATARAYRWRWELRRLLHPTARVGPLLSGALVPGGEPLPAGAAQTVRRDGRPPLRRHRRLARQHRLQRAAGRHQLAGPSGQTQSPRLPQRNYSGCGGGW